MRLKQLFFALLIALITLAIPATALAAPPGAPESDDIVIFGQDYTLAAGETQIGSILVFGGNVTLETDSTVTDSLVVFGGNVTVDGTVTNDLIVIGGNVQLDSNAIIKGDVLTPGGNIDRDPAAQVLGDQVSDVGPDDFREVHVPWNTWWFTGIGQLVLSGGVAIVALLLTLFFPDQLNRVTSSVAARPFQMGGFGLLSLLLMLIAFVVLFITCLVPLAIILLFITGWIFGWTAIGLEVGRRLSNSLQAKWTPVFEVALGTFLLSIVVAFVTLGIPPVGFLLGLFVGAAGFGAVILTRFGTFPPVRSKPVTETRTPKKRKATKRTKR